MRGYDMEKVMIVKMEGLGIDEGKWICALIK